MPVRRPKNLPDGRTVLSATLGLARGAPPVSEKDSSVGALTLSPEDGFARRLLRMTPIVGTQCFPGFGMSLIPNPEKDLVSHRGHRGHRGAKSL